MAEPARDAPPSPRRQPDESICVPPTSRSVRSVRAARQRPDGAGAVSRAGREYVRGELSDRAEDLELAAKRDRYGPLQRRGHPPRRSLQGSLLIGGYSQTRTFGSV